MVSISLGDGIKRIKVISRRKKMPRAKTTKKRTYKRKNVVGNFRGSEDIFWTKVVNGFKKFLEPPTRS